MKIVVLQGSPNRRGSTYLLADSFPAGRGERGAHRRNRSTPRTPTSAPAPAACTAGTRARACRGTAWRTSAAKYSDADMLVFATPLYYYGMTAQLKALVDRFCAFNASLTRRHMKSALLAVAWNDDGWTFEALEAHYKTLVRYLAFRDAGMVLGGGCGTPAMTKNSRFIRQAYEFGKNLK